MSQTGKNPSGSPLENLPYELLQKIATFLPNKNAANLGLACKAIKPSVVDEFKIRVIELLKTTSIDSNDFRLAHETNKNQAYICLGYISLNEAGQQPHFFGLRCVRNDNGTFTFYKLEIQNIEDIKLPRADIGTIRTSTQQNIWVECNENELEDYINTLECKCLVSAVAYSNLENIQDEFILNLFKYIKSSPNSRGNSKTSVTYNSKVYKLYGQDKEKYIRVQRKKVYLADIRGKYRYLR
jgi:hypothetical protein